LALSDKAEATKELALTGAAIGSLFSPVGAVVGGGIGGITGLIVGDNTTVFPVDMVAVPAFEYASLRSNINANPSFMVYIKAGETLVPTGGNVLDMSENMDVEVAAEMSSPKKRRKGAGLPKKYAKMGFKKGWAAYNKTPKRMAARKKAKKKKTTRRRK